MFNELKSISGHVVIFSFVLVSRVLSTNVKKEIRLPTVFTPRACITTHANDTSFVKNVWYCESYSSNSLSLSVR